ncbi:hypothetical protein KP509_04G054500 [Ceratopteris richardii]|uniref:Uncharacterized protein n=1 Tax=Ceratopteris richardii TaxID=49495 RepID=A0A8T2V0K8_CERRI|nr:hypothetical protein KP509_04G054500 [Ceratopteris richardii]
MAMASAFSSPPSLLGSSGSLQGHHRHLQAFVPAVNFRECCSTSRFQRTVVSVFGGNTGGDPGKDKKKFITKEEEPEQYWQSAAEKEGRGPMSTILPYIVIFGFLTPFIILGLGFANGWIKVPVR